jgi:hypothetical protein
MLKKWGVQVGFEVDKFAPHVLYMLPRMGRACRPGEGANPKHSWLNEIGAAVIGP